MQNLKVLNAARARHTDALIIIIRLNALANVRVPYLVIHSLLDRAQLVIHRLCVRLQLIRGQSLVVRLARHAHHNGAVLLLITDHNRQAQRRTLQLNIVLDRHGRDVLSARSHQQLLNAPRNVRTVKLIDISDIARMEKALSVKGGARLFNLMNITHHRLPTAVANLATAIRIPTTFNLDNELTTE